MILNTYAALKRRSSTLLPAFPNFSESCRSRRFDYVLQMFTHVSPTPFVSEQNPLKDAKMKAACSVLCAAGVLKRTDAT